MFLQFQEDLEEYQSDKAIYKAAAKFESLSLEERIQRLKDCGILDSNGSLAEFYRGDNVCGSKQKGK